MEKHYIKDVNEIPGLEYFRQRALEVSKKIDKKYIFCEVGTREGNSGIQLLDAIKESNKERWFFTIDPYGDKLYRARTDIKGGSHLDYDEQCYRNGMMTLHKYAFDNNLLYCHWRMTSEDFMNNITSIEFWHDGEKVDYEFGLVFLDGEHYEELVLKEFNWFKDRLASGGIIIIDDIEFIWQTDCVNESDYLKFLSIIFTDGKLNIHGGKLYYLKK